MGKGRNKNKDHDSSTSATGSAVTRSKKGRRGEYSDSDCESISTHITLDDDMRSVQGDDDLDEGLGATMVDALCEHIDNASHKNISVRLAALRHAHLCLTSNFMGSGLDKYKVTLADLATKAIKKTDEECVVGSQLLAIVAVQLGDDLCELVEEPLSLLLPVVCDSARTVMVRSTAALAIGITAYLSCENDDVYRSCVKALSDTWNSFKVGAQYTSLFCASLGAWSLLLGKVDMPSLTSALTLQPKLVSYVEGNQLEMRLSAGEAIAYLYELSERKFRDNEVTRRFPNHDHLCTILRELASESGKNKTKKDKRVQKMNFRQIYSFINDGISPSLSIKLDRETLELDSCSYKLIYDQLTELLRGGMRRHLKANPLLRDLFDMGDIAENVPGERMNKQSRIAVQNSINKVRDQQRARQRDKRHDF